MSKKMYTVADIAKITGYNRSTVTRWLDKQKIKNVKILFFTQYEITHEDLYAVLRKMGHQVKKL